MRSGLLFSDREVRGIARGLFAVATAGLAAGVWWLWYADNWGLTPERAAQRDGFCENAPVTKAQRRTATTAIVVCQGLSGPLDGGHVVVGRLPWGLWWASPQGANFGYRSPDAVSTEWVDYVHYGPTQSADTSLILLGRSRSSEVAAVEAQLSDGRTLKNEVANGLFVFDAPIQAVGVKVDELRLIGHDNQVMQRIEVKPGY
ncbi:hypothetical protein H6F75_23470 [Nodosilinea sp. FACHB-131]|uniref:hypothetical protein n=1 Tax=Cyanophyceae TaxID=3028117 RepID=UPI001686CA0A|nr:hypothetical protein [Nodosilinea sp. FACHB-131]MBD1876453.1 hypothetical protein [Nodosilinea sp. FACHB-131]